MGETNNINKSRCFTPAYFTIEPLPQCRAEKGIKSGQETINGIKRPEESRRHSSISGIKTSIDGIK